MWKAGHPDVFMENISGIKHFTYSNRECCFVRNALWALIFLCKTWISVKVAVRTTMRKWHKVILSVITVILIYLLLCLLVSPFISKAPTMHFLNVDFGDIYSDDMCVEKAYLYTNKSSHILNLKDNSFSNERIHLIFSEKCVKPLESAKIQIIYKVPENEQKTIAGQVKKRETVYIAKRDCLILDINYNLLPERGLETSKNSTNVNFPRF